MKPIFLIAAAALVAGCVKTEQVSTAPSMIGASDHAAINSGIRDRLKDPDSLKLRNVRAYTVSTGDRIICGEYNARNSFGGYTGYSPFYMRTRNGVVLKSRAYDPSDDLLNDAISIACQEAARGEIYLPADS